MERPAANLPACHVSRLTGAAKQPPPALRHIFRCPRCYAALVRTEPDRAGWWCCPRGLGHTKLIADAILIARCDQVIRARRFRRMKAELIVRRQRRIQFWMQRATRERTIR